MNDSFKHLSSELKPFATADSITVYLAKWSGMFFLVAMISLFLLPTRDDLSFQLSLFQFRTENLLWGILSLASGIALYYNSFPQYSTTKIKLVTSLVLVALLTISLFGAPSQHEQNLWLELDLWRGRCGFIIPAIALPHALFMYRWARQGATPSPAWSGVWASLSASAMGCFLMQLVCTHHSSTHLMLWHFLPLTLMCLLGLVVARKILTW